MPKAYVHNDKFYYQAKKAGFRARSIFKLYEIQKRFRLIKPGNTVLDLGAAPGSFLQYLSQCVGEKGLAMGVDLMSIDSLNEPNVRTLICDVYDLDKLSALISDAGYAMFDVITSDMAPKTTGRKDIDRFKSAELNEQVLKVAQRFLKPGGNLLTKIFIGEDFDPFLKKVRKYFSRVKCCKPIASRDRSKEIYIIGQNFLKTR